MNIRQMIIRTVGLFCLVLCMLHLTRYFGWAQIPDLIAPPILSIFGVLVWLEAEFSWWRRS